MDKFDEMVLDAAICLALNGYEAENPGCTEEEANEYVRTHVHLYLEDGYEWLLDQGRRLKAEKERGGIPFPPRPATP